MASAIDFVNRVAVLAVGGQDVRLGRHEQHVVEGQAQPDKLVAGGEARRAAVTASAQASASKPSTVT